MQVRHGCLGFYISPNRFAAVRGVHSKWMLSALRAPRGADINQPKGRLEVWLLAFTACGTVKRILPTLVSP